MTDPFVSLFSVYFYTNHPTHQAAAALVERGFGGRGREVGGGEAEVELRQKVQDALPRLLTALLGCAGAEEADVGVKVRFFLTF